MFQRHAWTFPADSPLLDAKEDFTLEEEGRHCGANRAECVGVRIHSVINEEIIVNK